MTQAPTSPPASASSTTSASASRRNGSSTRSTGEGTARSLNENRSQLGPAARRAASRTKRRDTACSSMSCCSERWCPPGGRAGAWARGRRRTAPRSWCTEPARRRGRAGAAAPCPAPAPPPPDRGRASAASLGRLHVAAEVLRPLGAHQPHQQLLRRRADGHHGGDGGVPGGGVDGGEAAHARAAQRDHAARTSRSSSTIASASSTAPGPKRPPTARGRARRTRARPGRRHGSRARSRSGSPWPIPRRGGSPPRPRAGPRGGTARRRGRRSCPARVARVGRAS